MVVEYPYKGERWPGVDRATFDLLAKHFDLVPEYGERNDHGIFLYDEQRVRQLPTEELREVVTHVLVYGSSVFDYQKAKFSGYEDADRLVALLKERGFTRDSYLDTMIGFEFPQLGNESAQVVGIIAYALGNDADFGSEIHGMGSWHSIWQNRNIENTEKCAKANQGRARPFELEHMLKIGSQPVAVDYANTGKLYVFDRTGTLHEFTDGKKTNEWQVRYGTRDYYGPMDEIFHPVFPNISVHDRTLFLTNGSSLERHDLDERKAKTQQLERRTGADIQLWKDHGRAQKDFWFHDVCIREGNVFVSASLQTSIRYILQVFEDGTHKIGYQNRFPRDPIGGNNLMDLTLRLGFFHGGLYFSEGNGISLFTAEGPKEMLGAYKRDIKCGLDINPITKFAFGTDFMMAVGTVEGFQMPMLQIFRPVYDSADQALVAPGNPPQPTRFERVYITDIPKQIGRMIKELSPTAHGDRFAFTHQDFDRVFVYRMKPSGSI